MVFWPHRGMTLEWEQYMCDDVVHLNLQGNVKYARRVRGAILDGIKRLKNPSKSTHKLRQS